MNGNSPFIIDSSHGLFFFFMALSVIGIIVTSFQKNQARGIVALIASVIGAYFFVTSPPAQKYLSAGFSVFLLIGLWQWLKEKFSEGL